MKDIIPPVDRNLLEQELSEERFVRNTNNGNNRVYIVREDDSPATLREIGRLREITFRNAGGGTGKECDLDEFDSGERTYSQLIVWNPEDREIVGGYRFIKGSDVSVDASYRPSLATSHLLNFSKKFIDEYLPLTVELGRSFVQPKYQPSSQNRKGLFSLDNLWDGLGAIVVLNPEIRFFFGKVTMYTHFNPKARDMIIYFMNYYFPDPEGLVTAKDPMGYKTSLDDIRPLFRKEMSYKEAHTILNQNVRLLGENIPPLINAYMNLSPTMRTFGTAVNDAFGDVEETGIMVTLNDIYPTKKERHLRFSA